MKHTLAFDVDGVVADLQTAWLARYNKDWNDDLTSEEITEWGSHKFVKPECGMKYYDYLEDPSLYDEVIPTTVKALECINDLKRLGNRIIYVTTTVLGANGAKYKWLKKWGFVDRMEDYIEATDKNLVNADALIDDSSKNTRNWWSQGNKLTILVKRPHNAWEKVPFYHTNDWDYIYNILSEGIVI